MLNSGERASQDREAKSLPDVHRSIKIPAAKSLRRILAFAGPAYLVSVGYMDPGNWATDLAGGSRYGYTLLWVILASSLMAMFLQTLCARLGIIGQMDLAQACRRFYPKEVAFPLWLLAEVAIIACDVAEVIGAAIALKLLFGLPLIWGVLITGFDVLLLLALMRFGFRKIEAIILALVGTIFVCFAANLWMAKPDLGAVARGLVTPSLPDQEAILIAVGILGATVMPHNLYLHSAVVQTRDTGDSEEEKHEAVRMATWDTLIALGGAFFVNAAILILAGAVFFTAGKVVTEIDQAHEMLRPALGGAAATMFAVALLASGQSSTMTGTLAGQIVMEGFLQIRVAPWLRRLITRGLAIIPAVLIVTAHGKETAQALVFSQVVLSMQLPFAVIPLLLLTSRREVMGKYANLPWAVGLGVLVTAAILVADIYLLISGLGWQWVTLGIVIVALYGVWVKSRPRLAPTR